ncbi:MAG: hypothetical protein NTV11_08335 [Rhodocyclales bacterium]|nr:hypothetical protein [Rhodocyclales bacterium]
MKPHHWPWTFVIFTALGGIGLLAGIGALAGMLRGVHPLFNDDMAGWALIVSAVACFLTGAFPLVLRRLAEREGA